jgi:hypothetical protein
MEKIDTSVLRIEFIVPSNAGENTLNTLNTFCFCTIFCYLYIVKFLKNSSEPLKRKTNNGRNSQD